MKKHKFHKGDILISCFEDPVFIIEAKGGYYHYDYLKDYAMGDFAMGIGDYVKEKYEQLEERDFDKVGKMTTNVMKLL